MKLSIIKTAEETPIVWWASSYGDLQDMDDEVKDSVGYALGTVQLGDVPECATRMKGSLRAVMEIRVDLGGDTYRAFYTTSFPGVIYVLDVLKKKSKRGRETPQADINRILDRLKRIREHYSEHGPPGT